MFRYRKLASALMVAGALNSGYVSALGLGEMTMHSALNQPLDAEIKLRSVGDLDDVQILVKMADAKAFEEAGIDRAFFLNNVKFQVVLDEATDSGIIKLSSKKRLNEPFLDFLLDVKWPSGRVLRSYTALVDLPAYSSAAPAVSLGKADAVKAVKNAPKATTPQQVSASPVKSVDVTDGAGASNAQPAADTAAPSNVVYQDDLSGDDGAADEGTYRIKRDDTLWGVARRLKPANDISVQQTMMAIQRMNEHAFVAGNINRLKAGEVIRIPTDAMVRDISARQAMDEVKSQNREWQQVQLDATDGRQLKQVAAPDEKSYLRLSSAGTGTANGAATDGADGVGGAQSSQHAAEELEVSRLENEELNSRVDSLNSQVEQLQRLLELKDAELAAMQQKLGQVNAQTATDDAPVAAPEAADQAPAADEPVVADAEPQAAEQPQQEDAAPAEPAPQPEPVVTPPAPEPVPEESLVDQILAKPIYLGVLAVLILVGVAGFLFRRKSKEEQEAFDELTNFEFDDETDADADVAQDADAMDEGFASDETLEQDAMPAEAVAEVEDAPAEEETAPETTTMQTGDAIGEADIYIAYGRYEQAAELLQNAIAASPDEVDLRTKLLEVHLESQNKEGFQQQFQELQARGHDDAVSHAKELLTSVEGASSWLDDMSDTTAVPASEAPADLDVAESLDDDLDLDLDLGLDDADTEVPALDDLDLDVDDLDISLDADDDVSDDLSLDLGDLNDDADDGLSLDLSDDLDIAGDVEESEDATQIGDAISIDDALLAEPAAENETITDTAVNVSDDLDLDLDLDLGGDLDEDLGADLALDETPVEEPASDSAELDLDLDLGEADDDLSLDLSDIDETNLDANIAEAEPEAAPEEDVLDFDGLDLGDLSVDEEPAAPEAVEEEAGDFDLDLDLDMDLGATDDVAEAPVDQTDAADDTSLDMDLDLSDLDGDLDLDVGDLDVADSADEVVESAAVESADIELEADNSVELDLDLSEPADDVAVEEPAADNAAEDDLSFEEADFDLAELDDVLSDLSLDEASDENAEPEAAAEPEPAVESEVEVPAEPVADVEVPAPQAVEPAETVEESPLSTLEGEDLEFLSDADEVSTKLDLAQAYVEMGDVDGARDILMEVMKEGNDEQKSEATTLLDTLD